MKICSEEWNSAFAISSIATQECVGRHLKREGKFDSFDATVVFEGQHRTRVMHAKAIVHHCSRCYLFGTEIRDMISLIPIHICTGMVLGFFGTYREEEKAWEGQLRALKAHHGNDNHPTIAGALTVSESSKKRKLGNWSV